MGKHLEAPPGMFKDLDDRVVGEARMIRGKQLFIDDFMIEDLQGARKVLNQPVKHPANPLMRKDRPWEFAITYGAIVRDESEGLYRLWYQIWNDEKDSVGTIGCATSGDGMAWEKPVTDPQAGTNLAVFEPREAWAGGPGVLLDATESDPQRRYKMIYLAKPTMEAGSLSGHVACSEDGIHWRQDPLNPVFPYSDTQPAPYRDPRSGRYVAFLRFGPPNVRIISRIESEDFVHWSPKVTVVRKAETTLDAPFSTVHYTMSAVPYEGVYIGLLNTYHGETIKPIPPDQPWMDRLDAQLVFSRNGVTWQRVLKEGAVSAADLLGDRDWKQAAEQATFLPYGELGKDWDWGQIYPHHAPLVVGDEIRFYYTGIRGRHWNAYHKEEADHGVGLATLRLDGFVSVESAGTEGTLTTRPFVFIGDALEVNADARGGSITVEAVDLDGKAIEGFSRADAEPVRTDDVRHLLKWSGSGDAHLLQARPIRLKFHIRSARLFSFTPRVLYRHYIPSYQ